MSDKHEAKHEEERVPETQPEARADTLPAPPEKKLRCHKCCHEEAEKRETVIEGTAPGRWEPCKDGAEGAFCDSEGRWQRWVKTGADKKFSVHVHKLAPGDAAKVSHVTTRFGMLPRDCGVVHWTLDADGNLLVRPALPGHDLDLQVHLEDGDG